MFAPPVAKPKAMQPQRSTVVAQRPSQSAVSQAHLLQRSIGNQAMIRLLAQRGSVTRNEPGAQEKEADSAHTVAQEATPSWDFGKIPVFSPGRAERFQMPPFFPAPRLPLQAKLKVGAVNDPLEHEADRVADQVMRMPAPEVPLTSTPPQISRKCDACEEEKKLQKKEAGPQAAGGEAPGLVHEVLRSPGQPLDEATRAYFEPHFGHDFSGVRVHTDAKAAESARAVDALAYTVGHDVVFGSGRYSSGTSEGKRLLAHELAHVVQQRGGDAGPSLQRFTAGEKHQIAPTFTDMLAQIKTLIDKATTSSLLGDELNLDYLVEIAGGTSAGRKMDEKLKSKQATIKSQLLLRYLFTCRCGLIDMRHFFQLFYLSNFYAGFGGISQSRANQKATQMGREHELTAEHESQFAPEDTPSNALAAFTNIGLAATPLAGAVFDAFKNTLTTCGPTDFKSLNPASQDKIVQFYSAMVPDPKPQKPGGQIPKNRNETAIPEIPDIAECGGRERSFPFGLDSDDPDRKTLSGADFEKGSTDMTSGREIRNFVFTQRPEVIRGLPLSEKIRMLKVLLSGEVSKDDEAAAVVIHKNSSAEDYGKELDAISPTVKPLEGATLHVEVPPPTYDGILLPVLEHQFQATDQSGPGQRVNKLEEFFGKFEPEDAKRLYTRLKARRPGDKVAYLFHHVLHPASQERLLKVLQH